MVDCKLGMAFLKAVKELNVRNAMELGAGAGLLTKFLTPVVNHLIAVEIDVRLAKYLTTIVEDHSNVSVILGDGLHLLKSCALKVDAIISNTPYSITGPLIASIVKSNVRYGILTLQKEVADRLVSSAGSSNYGRITAFTNIYMRPKILSIFSPDSFYPRPKVWSALLVLERVRSWSSEESILEELIKCLFNQRKRKATKVLGKCVEDLNLSLEGLNLVKDKLKDLRVFELSPNDIYEIFMNLIAR